MATSSEMRHQSIISYVKNGTTLFNTLFLLIHISFEVFFYISGATILFYYNMFSIATYIIGYVILYFTLSKLYSTIVNLEVFIFMTLCTICLGWEYGFQQYCLIFVASFLFTDFCLSKDHKLQKTTIFTIIIAISTYFALRIWTYTYPSVYDLDYTAFERLLFIGNSLIAYGFLIAYSFLYSQTVLRLEQTLVDVATKDALTGLYNRRKMQDLLKAMTEVMSVNGHQMCLAMIDIDDFKKVNDTYGHDAGDEVIKTVANILIEKSRTIDGFNSCRWGGEEFLILYRSHHKDTQDVVREFDAMREQIAQNPVTYNEQTIPFTITIGLTFYQENISIDEMVKRADDNLYTGKNTGKNVVIYK